MSTRVSVETTVELQCLPPEGKPLPKVRTQTHIILVITLDVCISASDLSKQRTFLGVFRSNSDAPRACMSVLFAFNIKRTR